MTKKCTTCKAEKFLREFHRNKSKPDGLSTSCAVCGRASVERSKQRKKGLLPPVKYKSSKSVRITEMLRYTPSKAKEGDLSYVLRLEGTNYIKLGKSAQKSWGARLNAYKTHQPFDIEILYLGPGGHELEYALKLRLVDRHHRGEWYTVDDFDALLRTIESCSKEVLCLK